MVRKTRYALMQREGRWKSPDAERVGFRWCVALRAALSAAPEPRLRRVSGIRLQSLTQKGGGCGYLAPAPSSHSSLVGLASIACVRLMRSACHRGLDSQAAKKRQMHDRQQDRVDRMRFTGGLLRRCQRRHHEGKASVAFALAHAKRCPKTLPLRGRAIVTNTVLPSSIAKARRSLACLVPDNFHLRRPPLDLEWIGSDRRPAPPRSSSRNSRRQLFSAARAALCIAKQKSHRRPSGAGAVPFGCGPIVPGRTTTIEVAIGAARLEKGTRQWQPSAPSPRPRTASPARSRP